MTLELYKDSINRWPKSGSVILAAQTEKSITVYQAYRPAIANYAVANQCFGGEYSFSRMSWIKPNFLWMMYRSGWATKEGQEKVLAITIAKQNFDEILSSAVHSSFNATIYGDIETWQKRVETSAVRLQWDPDHDPYGKALERRAIQLGLRGSILKKFATDWIESIEDVTDFVTAQNQFVLANDLDKLQIPYETIYAIPQNVHL